MSASATSKLTLLMELKNKLFNEKLMETKRKFTKVKDKMMGGVKKLKMRFVNAFQAMRDEIPLFGRAMDLLGNPYALIIAGVVALTAALGKGFVEAKKFNHEFLQIKQLNLDKSSSQLSLYKEQIRDAAFDVGTGLQDSTKAFYDLQSATGVYGKGAVEIFKKVGRFSISTGASLEDSMNATTKAMKAFNLQLGDIDNLLESNAKTVQTGITTFDELAKVQTQFGGAAGNIGQSVETANKLFASFTAIGGSVSEAATLTKTFFQGLAQRGKQIEKHLNIKVFDEKGNFKQADQILKDIADRFSNLSQQQVADLIAKIGGPDGLNQMLFKMKGNAGDVINTFDSFDGSKFNLGAALKNAQGDVTILSGIVKNRFNTAMSKLGEIVLPLVIKGLDYLNAIIVGAYNAYNSFVKWLNSGSLGAEIFKGALYGLVAALVITNAKLIIMTTWIGIVKTATAIWTGVQWLLNVALTANPIGLVIVAIGALVGAIIWVVKKTEGWGKSWKAFKKVVSIVWEQMKLNFFFFVDSMKYGAQKMWLKFKNIGQHIVGFAQKVKEAVKLAWQGNFSAAKDKMKEEIVTEADKQLEELERKRKSQVSDFRKQTFQNVKDIAEASKGISLKWKKSSKEETSKEGGLLGGLTGGSGGTGGGATGGGGGSLGQTAGSQISNVQGQASGPRTINIHIDAINKGGINTSNTTLAGMNAEEIEEWFTETIMRTIRGIELSHG